MPETKTSGSARRKSAAKRGTDKPSGPGAARRASRRTAEPQRPMAEGPEGAARREMIAVAAYYLAEHRGFAPGDPLSDWLRAEAEIDRVCLR